MRKFTTTIYMLLLLLTCMAQSGNMADIRKKIADINNKLPLSIDSNCTIDKLAVEDGCVVQYGTCSSSFDQNGKSLNRTWGESFLEQGKNEGVRVMYQEYMSAGFGVKQIMRFKDSGKTASNTFTVNDLGRMMSFPAEAYSVLLNEIRVARKSLPFAAGVGIMCVAYEFSREDMIMCFDVDEEFYSMDDLQDNASSTKKRMLSQIADRTSKSLLMARICVNAGYGMGLCYIGKTSGKKAEVIMTYQELKTCFDD